MEFGLPRRLVELIMECVTTVQYSLLINGGLTPIFEAKKGLRQGDPMSPYLFVLSMEYLHRTLKQLRHNPQFNYHPRCKKLGLIHICFADDQLMNCRADEVSIKLLFNTFKHFSEVSGIKANMEKSSLYIAGVTTDFREKMLAELHLSLGELPFKYLGVSLSTRKLTIHHSYHWLRKSCIELNVGLPSSYLVVADCN